MYVCVTATVSVARVYGFSGPLEVLHPLICSHRKGNVLNHALDRGNSVEATSVIIGLKCNKYRFWDEVQQKFTDLDKRTVI